MKKTKKAYEEYLNEYPPEQDSEKWIIGGKIRLYYKWRKQYGSALRAYDPIVFRVGYRGWID